MSSISFLVETINSQIEKENLEGQLFESDCELTDKSRSPSPELRPMDGQERSLSKRHNSQQQRSFELYKCLLRYLRPLSELLHKIEQEVRRLEEGGDVEKKRQGEQLKMMQQEVTRTHRFIATLSETTEISEEVFSAVKKRIEGWIDAIDTNKTVEGASVISNLSQEDKRDKTPSSPSQPSSLRSHENVLPCLQPPQFPFSNHSYPSFPGWGPVVLPPPSFRTGMSLPYHQPLHLPPLVPTPAQAAYFQLKDHKVEHSLPSLREKIPEMMSPHKVLEAERENKIRTRSPSPTSEEGVGKKRKRSSPKIKKEEAEAMGAQDRLNFLVQSATEMSEQFERDLTKSKQEPEEEVEESGVVPQQQQKQQEDAQLLLSKLAEICQERAKSEFSDSNDEEEEITVKDKKKKKSSKKNKKKRKSKGKDKKSKKRKLEDDDLSASPEQSDSKDKKTPRRTKTPEQLEILEREYTISIFPSTAKRLAISKLTGLTPRGVQIWFQNKRAKDKANKRSQRGSADMPYPMPPSPHHNGGMMPSPHYPYGPGGMPHHQIPMQQQQQHMPPHAPFPSSFAPAVAPASGPSVKSMLPPPSAVLPSFAPFGAHSNPPSYTISHQQTVLAPSSMSAPPPSQPQQASLIPRNEIHEIWQGTLSWPDETGMTPTLSLSARAHEWSEPAHYVRECPKQLVVSSLASYSQYENSFRRADATNSMIEFYPANESSRLLFDALIRQLGNLSKCAVVYLGGKGIALAAADHRLFGCLV